MDGWDHHISADENDMKQIVNGCKRAFDGLGSEKIIRIESQDRVDSFLEEVLLQNKKYLKVQLFKDPC